MLYLSSPDQGSWQRFVGGETVDLSDDLAKTWTRSLSAGADWRSPLASRTDPFVDQQTTRERQEAGERAWRHVAPVLERLSIQLARSGFLGVWADTDGVILHRRGGGTFLDKAQHHELLEGANWNEAARGTNAIGTALRESCEVAVLGRAHLQEPNHDLVCYAAPILSPRGVTLGVLDATSHLGCAHDMALATVVAARRTIELALKLSAYRDALPGGLDELRDLLDRCASPALLVEHDGTVRAANDRARVVLDDRQTTDWSWRALERQHQSPTSIELVDERGAISRWRPRIEPIGPDDRAMAALVFLEPVSTSGARVAGAATEPIERTSPSLDQLYGHDSGLQHSRRMVSRLAPTELPILIVAETGTGKENLARAFHELSPRARGPFVAINCGSLPETLVESELFGYAPGAFTGAKPGGAQGKVAAANGGTLFLDEVAELPVSAQATLLRVLESGRYHRVGEATERKADIRIVAATCRDLEALVHDGTLRADLYFRLKGARLTMPPLRQRTDLSFLANRLLQDLATHYRAPHCPTMSTAFLDTLRAYPWPGNVRELKNTLHVAWVLGADTAHLTPDHLPEDIRHHGQAQPSFDQAPKNRLQTEAEAVQVALDHANGNMSQAARSLGVARSTLYRLCKRHGLG
ncbi:MAG: sigma-54-dependent Fis family transcriptional regulator [Acidobacteriota bacterium]